MLCFSNFFYLINSLSGLRTRPTFLPNVTISGLLFPGKKRREGKKNREELSFLHIRRYSAGCAGAGVALLQDRIVGISYPWPIRLWFFLFFWMGGGGTGVLRLSGSTSRILLNNFWAVSKWPINGTFLVFGPAERFVQSILLVRVLASQCFLVAFYRLDGDVRCQYMSSVELLNIRFLAVLCWKLFWNLQQVPACPDMSLSLLPCYRASLYHYMFTVPSLKNNEPRNSVFLASLLFIKSATPCTNQAIGVMPEKSLARVLSASTKWQRLQIQMLRSSSSSRFWKE